MSLVYLTASNLSTIPRIRHGFFTRQGGHSTGIYASLNCGFGTQDDPALVAANRVAVAQALGAGQVLTAYQCHTAKALIVDRPFETLPKVDALVTATPGLAIGVLAADCGPILFAADDGRVIGAAHAGWKGALYGIIESTIVAMETLGAKRKTIRAALGPCIGQASYQVGAEFRDTFIYSRSSLSRFFLPDGDRFRFDLGGFIRFQLEQAGIGAVEDLAIDTYPDTERFFSYRRTTHRGEADYGRQISAIVIGG
jgi:YfiH family protein